MPWSCCWPHCLGWRVGSGDSWARVQCGPPVQNGLASLARPTCGCCQGGDCEATVCVRIPIQQPTQPTNLARCLARRPPCAWRRPAALPKVLFMPSSSLPAVSISTAAARLYTLTRPPMPLSVGCIMSSVVERPAVDMVAECAVCLSVRKSSLVFGSKSKSIKIVCVCVLCVCTCDCTSLCF